MNPELNLISRFRYLEQVKSSKFARSVLAAVFVISSLFTGLSPASATSTTLAFDGPAPTFTAGSASPAMGLVVTPGDGNPYNRIKIEIFDSNGTTLETSGQINMGYGVSSASCFAALNAPLIGCTKNGDDAGFFEYSNGTTGTRNIQLNAGLFTMPSVAGNYTIRVGLYNGGSETSSATVAFSASQPTQFTISFDAGGGTGTQSSITTSGTFTLPSNTFMPPSGKVFSGWVDIAVSNTVLLAGNSYTVSQNTTLTAVWVNSGNQQQNQAAQFSVSNFNFSTSNNAPVGALSAGSPVPGFTYTASGFSNNTQVNMVNLVLGDPDNGIFYTVPNALQQSNQSYVSWDPAASTCGITAVSRGGVLLTASSGVTCQKFTVTQNSVTQYWVSLRFATASSDSIGIQIAQGVYVSTGANSAYKFSAILFNNTNNSITARAITQQAFSQAGSGGGIGSAPSALVSMSFPVSPGQRIFGEAVSISANDLAVSTDYSVILRSTPQILAQGRTVSSSFNTSVTIPNNLEAGWHSITFSATRSNGEAISEVVYFKILSDGTLLETSTSQPAELALTPAPQPDSWFFAFLILLLGFGAFFVAREINPEFMRVMTLAKNEHGEWEFTKRRIRSEDF